MNLQSVIKINGVVCELVNHRTIIMNGRKKQLYLSSRKIVENDRKTGKWRSIPIRD